MTSPKKRKKVNTDADPTNSARRGVLHITGRYKCRSPVWKSIRRTLILFEFFLFFLFYEKKIVLVFRGDIENVVIMGVAERCTKK